MAFFVLYFANLAATVRLENMVNMQDVIFVILGLVIGFVIGSIIFKKDKDWSRIMSRSEKKSEKLSIGDIDLDFFDHDGARFVLISKNSSINLKQIK